MSGLSGGDGGQVLAIYVFFLVLCTTAVGLRLFTRVRLSNSVLGLDDAVLTICYVRFPSRLVLVGDVDTGHRLALS